MLLNKYTLLFCGVLLFYLLVQAQGKVTAVKNYNTAV
jgi:hypothetical protein